jgi:hypothetical protein
MDSLILKPEEAVRQNMIAFLVSLGFPRSHIIQEKALSELPHLQKVEGLPLRRVDILAYGLINNELKPLVLIECKALSTKIEALHQILGYNHFVEAPFIALASKSGYLLFKCKTKTWLSSFESYTDMCLQA